MTSAVSKRSSVGAYDMDAIQSLRIAGEDADMAESMDIEAMMKDFHMSSPTNTVLDPEHSHMFWLPCDTISRLPSAQSESCEILAAQLEVHEMIGEGSRCQVFLATLNPDREPMVVKRLRTGFDASDSAKREAIVTAVQALSESLRHPSIVDFCGCSLDDATRTVNLIYELMGGGTLEDYFHHALEFLHGREDPIILRDLKPRNILLSADANTLKIRNFAVSKTVDLGLRFWSGADNSYPEATFDVSKLSGPSNQCYTGTARYMAPEIDTKARGAASYTPAVDIYSAGLVTWLILHAERPWENLHGQRARSAAILGQRPPLEFDGGRYPMEMGWLIQSCWDADPACRPSAEQAVECLEDMVEEVRASAGAGLDMEGLLAMVEETKQLKAQGL